MVPAVPMAVTVSVSLSASESLPSTGMTTAPPSSVAYTRVFLDDGAQVTAMAWPGSERSAEMSMSSSLAGIPVLPSNEHPAGSERRSPLSGATAMRSCHCCAVTGVDWQGESQTITRSSRSGCFWARPSAVAPPIDRPVKCAFSIPSASISASASAISSSKV